MDAAGWRPIDERSWRVTGGGTGGDGTATATCPFGRCLEVRVRNRPATWWQPRRPRGGAATPGPLAGEAERQRLLEAAQAATAARDWTAAAGAWGALDAFDGGRSRPGVFVNLAGALRRAGRLDEAEAIVARGMARHPDNHRVAREAGEVAAERADWPQAARRFGRAVELAPVIGPEDHARHAELLRRAGEPAAHGGGTCAGTRPGPGRAVGGAGGVRRGAARLVRRRGRVVRRGATGDLPPLRTLAPPVRAGARAGRLLEQALRAYDDALVALVEVTQPWGNEVAVAWASRRE